MAENQLEEEIYINQNIITNHEQEERRLYELKQEVRELLEDKQFENQQYTESHVTVKQTGRNLEKVTRNKWKSDIQRLDDIRQHMVDQKQENEVLAEVRQMLIETLTILESHNIGRRKRPWYVRMKCW